MIRKLVMLALGALLIILGILSLAVICPPPATSAFVGISLIIIGILVTLLTLFLLRQCSVVAARTVYIVMAILTILLIVLGSAILVYPTLCVVEMGFLTVGLGLLMYGLCLGAGR